jgi:ketosteroid isomerase-like protein
MSLSRVEMITYLETYFQRLDAKDLDGLLALLTEDCSYRIVTQGKDYVGRDTEIRDMFARLYAIYDKVWHGNYRWAADAEAGVVACQLGVVNSEPDGAAHRNHNSSFFYFRDDKIAHVEIYIGGVVPKQLHGRG